MFITTHNIRILVSLFIALSLSACGGGGSGNNSGGSSADTTSPTITLQGDAIVTLQVGDTYTDAGATANDNIDGDLTTSIVVNSNVDTSLAGNYTVTYDVSDSSGNAASTATRVVNVTDTNDTTPPSISQFSPAENATDVPLDTVISITFNEAILNTSVDDRAIRLFLAGSSTAVESTIDFDGLTDTITLTPNALLASGATYLVSVNSDYTITDLNGNTPGDTGWQFTTVNNGNNPIGWQAATAIKTSTIGDADGPKVASDSNGTTFVVWTQLDGTNNYNVYSSRINGNSWSEPELISTGNINIANAPTIMTYDDGAVITWRQNDGLANGLQMRRYDTNNGWGSVEIIPSTEHTQYDAAMNSKGDIVLVMEQIDSAPPGWQSIYGKYYTASTNTWSNTELIEYSAGNAFEPSVVIDSAGNAAAAWRQPPSGSSQANTYSNSYDATMQTWGLPNLVENNSGGVINTPQVAQDANGNIIVAWAQYNGAAYDIYINRFDGNAWGTAQLLDNQSGNAVRPQIAINADGQAIVVWMQRGDDTSDNIYSSEYNPVNDTWSNAQAIDLGDDIAADVQITIDNNGNGLAVWTQYSEAYNDGNHSYILNNRFDANTNAWEGVEIIDEQSNFDSFNPQIIFETNGTATAVWSKNDNKIYGNRYE